MSKMMSTRAGRYIMQPTGHRVFIPAPLPPEPPVVINDTLQASLSRADRALTIISFPAASDLIKRLVDHGLLTEKTWHARNHRFSYAPYIAIFSEDQPSKEPPS